MKLFDCIEEYALKNPESLAFMSDDISITYGVLYNYLKYNQAALKRMGYKSGETVILKEGGQLEFAVVFLSLLSLGCWVVPVTADMAGNELERIAVCTKAKIYPDKFMDFSGNYHEYKNIPFIKPKEDSGGIYHLSSGTTSDSKLCIRTIRALLTEGLSYKKTLSIGNKDIILSGSPLCHSYALGAALMAALASGACFYAIDRFIPRKILGIVQKNRITILILVPILAGTLVKTYSEHAFDVSSLNVVLVGAGAITEEIYNGFKEKYGICLMSNYGSTETGGIISRLEPQPYKSIGKPMHGVQIKLKQEDTECTKPGEEGEVWVKCDAMLAGYLGVDETLFDEQGFFPMGDIAYFDADHNLYLVGRKKLFVSVGSRKVNPYEVEQLILTFPGVSECAVLGIRKKNGEEAVKALIVGEKIKKSDLRKYCLTKVSDYKVPSIIEFVSSIPKNDIGKIKRKELL